MKIENTESEWSECKGMVFRYSESAFIGKKNSIEYRKSIRLMKRMSCPGCDECKSFWADIDSNGYFDLVKFPCGIKNGDLLRLSFVPIHHDFDSGYLEDWCWELSKINDAETIGGKP